MLARSSDGQTIYRAQINNTSEFIIYRSVNAGATWQEFSQPALKTDLSYKVLQSSDILTLGRGLFYAYPSCPNLPPVTGQAFWISINGVDDNYKIIEAIPAGTGFKYFFKAKKLSGTWGGWEKYSAD